LDHLNDVVSAAFFKRGGEAQVKDRVEAYRGAFNWCTLRQGDLGDVIGANPDGCGSGLAGAGEVDTAELAGVAPELAEGGQRGWVVGDGL
jgi:hypothetical protein